VTLLLFSAFVCLTRLSVVVASRLTDLLWDSD